MDTTKVAYPNLKLYGVSIYKQYHYQSSHKIIGHEIMVAPRPQIARTIQVLLGTRTSKLG